MSVHESTEAPRRPGLRSRPNRQDRPARPWVRVGIAWAVALAALAAYLFAFVVGPLEFAFSLRFPTAGAILVAAFAQALATVLFHTVTDNRILTPSIMGFDSLFVLIQTVLVTVFGGMILTDLDGNTIMQLLDLPPGPMVGKAWRYLKELRLDRGPMSPEEAEEALRQWWAVEQQG